MQKTRQEALKRICKRKIDAIPTDLAAYNLRTVRRGCELTYNYDTKG